MWKEEEERADLGNAFFMLPSVECRPCDSTGILSLEEEGFGLAVLEPEDFTVAADVEFSLRWRMTVNCAIIISVGLVRCVEFRAYLSGVYFVPAECIFVDTHRDVVESPNRWLGFDVRVRLSTLSLRLT